MAHIHMDAKQANQDVASWCDNIGAVAGTAQEKPSDSHGFDWAEAMESGSACCLPSLSATPASDGKERRLSVVRHADPALTSLKNAEGDTLLMARASSDGCRFDIFVSLTGVPPLSTKSSLFGRRTEEAEPAPEFILLAKDGARKAWVLMSARCEMCEGRGRRRCEMGQVARIRHYMEAVGAGQAYCMDVELPQKQNGCALVTAPCAACEAASLDLDESACTEWNMDQTSRRPKWNIKHKTLTLNFRGRVTMASAKNFQLESVVGGEPRLLFGKVGEDKFVLDYNPPLGMVQAFAAALSVFHWQ